MQNVTQSCVLGTLGELRVFRGCELTLKAIKQVVENVALSVVDRDAGNSFPEAYLREDSTEAAISLIAKAIASRINPATSVSNRSADMQ